jgi:hypothetical protein
MSPNTFEMMLKGYPTAALILSILMVMIGAGQKSRFLLLIGLGLFLSIFIILIFFVCIAQVRCDREDCNERMERVWLRRIFFSTV